MGRKKRVDWICPKCDSKNRASWSEASGVVICQSCKAILMWEDVLSGAEILNLVSNIPPKEVDSFLVEKRFCPICGGELLQMGKLGDKTWFRCKQCGIDVAQETHEQNSISG